MIGIFDDLPEHMEIGNQPERNEIYATSTADVSVDGYEKIATIYDQNREEVTYDQISQFALDATVDGEDRRFFEHGGVDVNGVIRAAVGNVASGGIESGASTLSMQYVKNSFIQAALEEPTEEEQRAAYDDAQEQSFDRKLREMKLAIGLEKSYTKKEILTAYLNIANFGNATYGIQAAAQRYYSKNAADLALHEAASLVAIVQEPSARDLGDPEHFPANQARRDVILGWMLSEGSITQEQYDEAIATPVDETTVRPSPPANGCRNANEYAKWFCDYVVKSVGDMEFLGADATERQANWKKGGYKLYTTLDMDLQFTAQNSVWQYAPNNETSWQLGSAASSVEAGTGRVLTMAENKLFDDSLENESNSQYTAVNFNTAKPYGGSNGFQPGSTYKTFTLIDWLMQGHGVNERVNGSARTVNTSSFEASCVQEGVTNPYGGPWDPGNSQGETGTFSVRDGTVQSINGVFVSMAQQLDLCDINQVAADLGVERADGAPLETIPSSIIGTNTVTPLSIAGAYAAIGALGKYCEPIVVDRAVGPNGEDIAGQAQDCYQAIPQDVASTVIDVLKQVPYVSNTRFANPNDGVPLFGKTGTTDRSVQTWMASGTSKIGNAVWVGNISGAFQVPNSSYAGVRGVLLRHYITRDLLTVANAKYGGDDWPAPPSNLIVGQTYPVPDVKGQTIEQARATLRGQGFAVSVASGEVDSDAAEGTAAGTNPGAGAAVSRGASVEILVSNGAQEELPDVSGQTLEKAASTLQSAGFNNLAQSCVEIDSSSQRNKVVSTDPEAGTAVATSARITLQVGKSSCSDDD